MGEVQSIRLKESRSSNIDTRKTVALSTIYHVDLSHALLVFYAMLSQEISYAILTQTMQC